MPEKLPPENTGQKPQIQPNNIGLLVPGGILFTFPCRKSEGLKIPASNYRYSLKIPRPVTAETAGKSQPVTTDKAGKSRPVKTDTAGKSCGQ
jgi:hypothetical protein